MFFECIAPVSLPNKYFNVEPPDLGPMCRSGFLFCLCYCLFLITWKFHYHLGIFGIQSAVKERNRVNFFDSFYGKVKDFLSQY